MALIFSIASRKYLSAAFQLKHSYKTRVDILLILFFQVNITYVSLTFFSNVQLYLCSMHQMREDG